MIQRAQSLYLLIGFIAIVVMYFFPFAGLFWGSESGMLYLSSFEAQGTLSDIYNPMLMLIVSSLTGLGFLVSIFLFKNRVFQMRFNVLVFVFNAALIGLMFWIPERIADSISTGDFVNVSYKYAGAVMPLISLLLLVFANRAIRKDEIKVRAADRLR
ncbi:MAG: hypothetical protein C0592_02020 [Marinilabiliales bacterium]|nr:MAG: hypothetical protein C0592_02020 [Marinilabiliales bacterium]